MKKVLFTLAIVAIALQSQAQIRKSSNGPATENAIKINVSSLLFAHFAFQYERVLGKHTTACLGLRYRPKMALGGFNALNNTDPNGNVVLVNPKYSSLAITPEFRYYTKEAMRGFYVAPYLRYRNTPVDLDFEYTDANNQQQTDVISGKLNALTVGAMIGTNIFLSEKFNLDLFIIGGHFGRNTLGMNWESATSLSQADRDDLEEGFREIKESTSGINFDYSVTNNGFDITGKYLAFGFRGIGLNLVYKF